MKKIILPALISLSFIFSACLKGTTCKEKTVASEDAAMQSFATANSLSVTKHSSGMYYQIVNAGSGATPTLASSVSVKYTGKLLSGSVFESRTTPVTLPLSQTIAGWQLGIPLIQKGGIIKLIIPSSLAYGCNAVGVIPSNSILFFEIELVDVL